MTIFVPQQEIIDRLRAEAIDNVGTGWLSDLAHFDPEYDDGEQVIAVSAPVHGAFGAIDLGHLSRIVQGIIKEATS